MKLVIDIQEDVYTRLFDNGIQDNEIAVDDVCEMARAIRLGTPAEKVGRWIPVSKRLPEIHEDVILSLRSLDIGVGFRAKIEPYFYCRGVDSCYIDPKNVLAWMPLPEPYKQEVDE